MTPNQHGPLMPWAALMLQWPLQWVAKLQSGANPIKSGLNSDWGLQLDPMKPESLVIAYQLWRDEYVPESCTRVTGSSEKSRQKSYRTNSKQYEAKKQVLIVRLRLKGLEAFSSLSPSLNGYKSDDPSSTRGSHLENRFVVIGRPKWKKSFQNDPVRSCNCS